MVEIKIVILEITFFDNAKTYFYDALDNKTSKIV